MKEYNNEHVLICEYPKAPKDTRTLFKTLLAMDTEGATFDADARPLIAYTGLSDPRNYQYDFPGSAKEYDKKAIAKLGFELIETGTGVTLRPRKNELFSSNCVIDRKEMLERVVSCAEGLQYIARLYLIATNNQYSTAPTFESIMYGNSTCSLETVIPSFLNYCFKAGKNASGKSLPSFSYKDLILTKMKADNKWHVSFLPKTLQGMACIGRSEILAYMAALLLERIGNSSTADPYFFEQVEGRTLALKKSDNNTVVAELMDALVAKKVIACPNCGRPVFIPLESSKPFHSNSCQTRYSEKAKRLYGIGHSAEVVHEQFPYISLETIKNWPEEGR